MEWSTEHYPLAIFFWIERYSYRNKSVVFFGFASCFQQVACYVIYRD